MARELENATARELANMAPKWIGATDWAYFGSARIAQLLADLTDEVTTLKARVAELEAAKS